MISENMSANAISVELGRRLKQARLNANITQSDLASRTGLNRTTIISAEKGKAQLENFIVILSALNMTKQLNLFLPEQEISPIQLAKLRGLERQRASKSTNKKNKIKENKALW